MTLQTAIESSDRESEIIAAALDALYVARDNKALLVARAGTIISINGLAAQLCGSSQQALIGQTYVSRLLEMPEAPISQQGEKVQRWETVLRTGVDSSIPVEVVREPLGPRIPGALVYAIRDLRERRQAEAERARNLEALREREKQLRIQNFRFDTAINNMPQGLAMFDADLRLQVRNARFVELIGLSKEIVKPGLEFPALVAAAPFDEQGRRDLVKGGLTSETVLVLEGRNGMLLQVTAQPMADGGIVLSTEDITARERTKHQLQDYTRRLEESNGELQNFAYVASHDLQEPLRKIEAFAKRLERQVSELPDDARDSLDRIRNASQRMRNLIDALLTYARLSNSKHSFTRVNLDDVLNGVLSDMQVRIEDTGAEIKSDQLPAVDGDPTMLRQLFQNLISNSLKFTKTGVVPLIGITATLRTEPGLGLCAVLMLKDNGIGFDNTYKDQIFKIFQRLHGKLEYEGTGVGLATCRKIVDRHNGRIDADGRPGDGATFTVILPVDQKAPL